MWQFERPFPPPLARARASSGAFDDDSEPVSPVSNARKALVTGGAGFTGVHLVRALVDDGWDVTCMDIADPERGHAFERDGVEMVRASIDDAEAIERTMPGTEVVFNLASAFRDIHQGMPLFQRVDVRGTEMLFESAIRHGVRRIVHCSTQGVHGSLDVVPGNEGSPLTPIDYYCEAKVDAEEVCRRFVERGLDVVILRPTSIYGPGDTHGWLKLFRMVRKGKFVMIGTGNTCNHPVYVENLVQGFVLAADAPEQTNGRAYLIGDDRYVTLNELVSTIGKVQGVDVKFRRIPFYGLAYVLATVVELASKPFGIEPPIFRRRLTWFTTNRGWDISRARAELGYAPKVGLYDGLELTRRWYEQRGLLDPSAER